jgi:hypothetical protein
MLVKRRQQAVMDGFGSNFLFTGESGKGRNRATRQSQSEPEWLNRVERHGARFGFPKTRMRI